MGRPKTINYVSVEVISSGLFKTQVLSVLKHTATSADFKVRLCVLMYPWHLWTLRRERRELSRRCLSLDCELVLIPCLLPVKFAMRSVALMWLIRKWLGLLVELLPSADLWHCRGYLATDAVLQRRGARVVVFDMRSLWVDEHIATKTLKLGSKMVRRWRELERDCVVLSSYVLGVSEPMARIGGCFSGTPYQTVPISADLDSCAFNGTAREEVRKSLGWSHSLVGVYSGSFGLSGLNENALIAILHTLFNQVSSFRLLLLSSEPKTRVRELMSKIKSAEGRWVHIEVAPAQIGKHLSAGDFGMHALGPQPDSDSRLGTKVVEYWANQLPVVVTSTVGAAAKIIRDHGLGIVVQVDAEGGRAHDSWPANIPSRQMLRGAFRAFDMRRFGSVGVSRQHIAIYKACLNMTRQ